MYVSNIPNLFICFKHPQSFYLFQTSTTYLSVSNTPNLFTCFKYLQPICLFQTPPIFLPISNIPDLFICFKHPGLVYLFQTSPTYLSVSNTHNLFIYVNSKHRQPSYQCILNPPCPGHLHPCIWRESLGRPHTWCCRSGGLGHSAHPRWRRKAGGFRLWSSPGRQMSTMWLDADSQNMLWIQCSIEGCVLMSYIAMRS